MSRKKNAPETKPLTSDEKMKRAEAEIADLHHMTVGLLQVKWQQVFKEPSTSRNKQYLIKRIAYRLQEIAEGGLSERAKKRIAELAKDAPIRRRQPRTKPASAVASPKASAPTTTTETRDPRLPPVGTTIRKMHGKTEHRVRVHDGDFEYGGRRYTSLSAVAKKITGTVWNGWTFFGLKAREATA